jgi:hypothetical protein
MSANEPFKASRIQVGKIVNAITADSVGNLIFSDIPNSSGVTLTELLKKIDANAVPFDSTGTFYTGVSTVQQALQYLNQAAYIQSVGRTLFVDPTVPNDLVVEGQIYNNLKSAIVFADNLQYNGYNRVNVVLMGSHRDQGPAELATNIGVHEFIYDPTWLPIVLKTNGISIVGWGQPTIRIKNFIGVAGTNIPFFNVESLNNSVSISIKDIHFEFVGCDYVSAIAVENAPINSLNKDKSGLVVENVGVSFINGTNKNVRLVDVSTLGTRLVSSVTIKDIHVGSFTNVTPSSEDIQLIYVDHNAQTGVNVENLRLHYTQQTNSSSNIDNTKVTSFTGVTVENGKVKILNPTLDEKSYWNGIYFLNVKTKLLKAKALSIVDIHNANIVRDAYNVITENALGTTLLVDWIESDSTVTLNATGIDEIFDLSIISPAASSIPSTSAPSTSSPASGSLSDVKPVKSFWNKGKFAFGIGNKNELRLGLVDPLDIPNFTSYSLKYGVPFWVNSATGKIEYWNGTSLVTVGSGGGGIGSKYTLTIAPGSFTPVTYTFPMEVPYSGFQVILNHNLALFDKNDFMITISDTATNRKIQPQEVIGLTGNALQLIMADTSSIRVSVIGL